MSMDSPKHVETAGGREFTVDAYPEAWARWSFQAKVNFLLGHTSPRCTYAEACAILSAHAAARRRAEAEQRARASQELIDKQEAGGVLISVEAAGQKRITWRGVHMGQPLVVVAEKDPGYLAWMAGQDWIRGELREAVLVLCHHHRDRIAAARTARRAMR